MLPQLSEMSPTTFRKIKRSAWALAAGLVAIASTLAARGGLSRYDRPVSTRSGGGAGRHVAALAPVRALVSSADGVVVLRAPGPHEVLLRTGNFEMGSTEAEAGEALAECQREPRKDDCRRGDWWEWEQPEHEVFLSDFWIDRTEVTVAAYSQCVAAGPCAMPPFSRGGERFDRPEFPVVLVTWNDAQRFCRWTGGRLPTEAEWERAARGLARRTYPWGNVYNPFLSNHGAFALEQLDPTDDFLELANVGSFPDGRTPDGLDDLAGNVEEWVEDWFAPEYPKASAVNPHGPDVGDARVVRGGSYEHGRVWLRGAARGRAPPSVRSVSIGFRCARSAI